MKKMVMSVILVSVLLVACSPNNAQQPQVFGQAVPTMFTIAQVKQQRDDALVTFTGKIQRQVDNDEYIVADSTGETQVEIDNHLWSGLNVTSADTIRIYGEVDKETFSTKVDAKSVETVK